MKYSTSDRTSKVYVNQAPISMTSMCVAHFACVSHVCECVENTHTACAGRCMHYKSPPDLWAISQEIFAYLHTSRQSVYRRAYSFVCMKCTEADIFCECCDVVYKNSKKPDSCAFRIGKESVNSTMQWLGRFSSAKLTHTNTILVFNELNFNVNKFGELLFTCRASFLAVVSSFIRSIILKKSPINRRPAKTTHQQIIENM